MDSAYLLMPPLAWLAAGSCKFAINTLRARRLAFDQVGYGGMPSTHTAIVTSMAALIGLRAGVGEPAFGVALTLAFIVMIDANSLRRQIGRQASVLNRLAGAQPDTALRERVGHSRAEIAGGVVVGIATAWLLDWLL